MIEKVIVDLLKAFDKDLLSIIDHQDGVHPNHNFALIGLIQETKTSDQQTIKSKTDKVVYRHSTENVISIAFQGNLKSGVDNISKRFSVWFESIEAKSLIRSLGYCARRDKVVNRIPIQRDTTTYIRFSHTLYLNSVEDYDVDSDFIEEIKMDFRNKSNGKLTEFAVKIED